MTPEIMIASTVAKGFVGSKAAKAADSAQRQVTEANIQREKNEQILRDRALVSDMAQKRKAGEYLKGAANVAAAKSGVRRNLANVANIYIGIETDAARMAKQGEITSAKSAYDTEAMGAMSRARSMSYRAKQAESILGAAGDAYAIDAKYNSDNAKYNKEDG